MNRLAATSTVQEPALELFPGNPLHRSRFQLSGPALYLNSPGVFLVGFDGFQAVEQPGGYLRAVLFVQCQSLANHFFDWRLHHSSLP